MYAEMQKRRPAEKRAPWTSSWANILYKPAPLLKKDSKRSAVPDAWGSPWENFHRNRQGFRINDAEDRYFSNDVMYKRAQNHIQELNSVPMLGKRDPEPYSIVDNYVADTEEAKNSEDTNDWDNWDWDMDFAQDSPLMADVALYPPVVGPHYRTILTRVQ